MKIAGLKYIGVPEHIIRLQSAGCCNRRVHPIVVMKTLDNFNERPIEQLGMYDPVRNYYGERVVSLNMDRITYWLNNGATVSQGVAELLGLSGITAVCERTQFRAMKNTQQQLENNGKDEQLHDTI